MLRYLLILAVLCLGGFWLYRRHEASLAAASPPAGQPSRNNPVATPFTGPAPAGFILPDRMIWTQTSHRDSRPGDMAEVVVVDGNRWRTESRVLPNSPITVRVYDGAHFASSPTNQPMRQGPVATMRAMLASLNMMRPADISECCGHLCWHYALPPDPLGVRCDIWMDTETRFPVFVEEWSSPGFHGEIYYSSMSYDSFAAQVASTSGTADGAPPSDSKPTLGELWPTFFDTEQTGPMFAYFITPSSASPSMTP